MNEQTKGDLGLSTPQIILMLGDCLERMKEIPDGSIDAVLVCIVS